MASSSGKKTGTTEKKKKTGSSSPKKKGGLLRGLKRIAILAIAVCIVFGFGMAKYGWKPFGLEWETFTGRSFGNLPDSADQMLDRAKRSAQDSMKEVQDAFTDTKDQEQPGQEDDLTEDDRKAKEEMLRQKGL